MNLPLPALSKRHLIALHVRGVARRIPYVWGAKPDPQTPIGLIVGSDCSGWVRYLVAVVTKGACVLPEGSAEIHATVGLRLATASYTPALADRHNLYIAFIVPTENHAGHVWFVIDGVTLECYGGHGVGSRKADAHPLPQEVAACYHWPGID